MTRRWLAAALFAGVSLLLCSTAWKVDAESSASAEIVVLAQGPVKSLPAGKILINILEFHQVPGADFGPHAHVPGIVYTLHGNSNISYARAAAHMVGPGEAAFIPALAVHTHQNLDGRIGAGAIAVGLIFSVMLLCAATWMRGGRRRVTIACLSLLLIAAGALPLTGATANDFYFIAVRGDNQLVPMPRPDGRVAYSSPDLLAVPAGPYIETLRAITVPAGARYDATIEPGPEVIVVVEGNAAIDVGGQTTRVGSGGAALAQPGATLAITNSGSATLRVIDFAVTPLSAAPG
jgi:quercetin dioxygenase-like cupin family protein